jgi:hypothetical protein
MKRTLDIEALRKKRQLNVQEQNALALHRVYQTASWFRANLSEVPLPIVEFLTSGGIDLTTAVDVDFEDMTMLGLDGMYRGLIVTAEGHFWRWELALNNARSAIDSVEEWRDVTTEYPVSEHLPGTGVSYGFMCLAVLAKLNATQQAVAADRAKPRSG